MYSRLSPGIWPLLACLLFVTLTACAEGANAPLLDASESRLNGGTTLQRITRLRVGDKLDIVVFGETNLSGPLEVNATGNIAMPLVGEFKAAGLSIENLRRSIVTRLSQGYLKRPRVSIKAMNYRPIYIHGEVRKGGEYPYRTGLRLRDAIALAGGFSYRGSKSYVLIVRNGKPGEFRVPFETNIEILPGDNIRVPERFF